MKGSKEFKFDKRASIYDEGYEGKLSKKFYKLLVEQVELCRGVTVLDVDCGTGTILKNLSALTDINGYGIDVDYNFDLYAQCVKLRKTFCSPSS